MAIHLDTVHTDPCVRDRLWLDILRGVPAVDAAHAEWQRKQAWMAAQAALTEPLHARVDACPALTCFVVGHAPDCECATL